VLSQISDASEEKMGSFKTNLLLIIGSRRSIPATTKKQQKVSGTKTETGRFGRRESTGKIKQTSTSDK
jgi:hypothetical protein